MESEEYITLARITGNMIISDDVINTKTHADNKTVTGRTNKLQLYKLIQT